MSIAELVSTDPCTGEAIWTGPVGGVAAAVARARAAAPGWARRPLAERIAIDSYRQMIDYVGDKDPTTRRMLEEILAVEEEHADELADFLE